MKITKETLEKINQQINNLAKKIELNNDKNGKIHAEMIFLASIAEIIKTNLNKDINSLIKKEEKNVKKAIKLVENLMLKIKKYNEIVEQKKERYTLRIDNRIDSGSWYQPKSLKSKLYEVKKWMEDNNEKK